ncbi:MAG: hypothetical protein FWH12_07710 [Treponema sp.]|nr:hypothetical protein [Treponema sp.]
MANFCLYKATELDKVDIQKGKAKDSNRSTAGITLKATAFRDNLLTWMSAAVRRRPGSPKQDAEGWKAIPAKKDPLQGLF